MNDGAGTRAGCPEEQGSCPYKCGGVQKTKCEKKARAGTKDEDAQPTVYAGHPLGRRAAR